MPQGRRRLRRTGAGGVGSEGARRQGWRRLRLRLRLRRRLSSDMLVGGRVEGIAVGSYGLLALCHGAVARRLRRPTVHCAYVLTIDGALLRGLGRLRGRRGGVLCVWVRDAQPAEGLGQAEVAIHRGSLWAARAVPVSGRGFSRARRVQWF